MTDRFLLRQLTGGKPFCQQEVMRQASLRLQAGRVEHGTDKADSRQPRMIVLLDDRDEVHGVRTPHRHLLSRSRHHANGRPPTTAWARTLQVESVKNIFFAVQWSPSSFRLLVLSYGKILVDKHGLCLARHGVVVFEVGDRY